MEIMLLAMAIVLYTIPSWIGANKKQANGIFVLNLFLGWTILGWIGALIWAVTSEKKEK